MGLQPSGTRASADRIDRIRYHPLAVLVGESVSAAVVARANRDLNLV